MKRILLIISILTLVLVPIGCAGNVIQSTIENALAGLRATYTIEVGGTEGLNFTGRYVVVGAGYDPVNYVVFNSTSYDVSDDVSKEYTVPGAVSVGGMFQKLSLGNETLEVKIWRGAVGTGTLVDADSTTEPYGAVLVTAVKE